MPGMVPFAHPAQAVPAGPVQHVVFVPVDGRVVFFFCLLLIAACVVWLGLLLAEGVRGQRDEL